MAWRAASNAVAHHGLLIIDHHGQSKCCCVGHVVCRTVGHSVLSRLVVLYHNLTPPTRATCSQPHTSIQQENNTSSRACIIPSNQYMNILIPTYPYASSVGRLPNVLVFRSQSLLPSDLDVVDDVSSLLFLPSFLLHRSRCVCVCVGVLTLPGNHVGAQARTPSRHGSSMSNYR
jgi:hypothetical protein